MKTKTKEFDCIKMKDQAALQIYAETKDMTIAEELAYWRQKHEEALEDRRRRAAGATLEPSEDSGNFRQDRASI